VTAVRWTIVEYDQWLFVRQMAGLLDSLGVSMPVTLVSVSHGAAMITSFADRYPGWVARYRVQQQSKGTREAWRRPRAAIALAPDQLEQLRRVGSSPRPVLVIWGRQDPVAPFSESRGIMSAVPRGALIPIDSAGHMSHADQPAAVTAAVVRALR